ncbi:MAG: hypothetical protein MUF10_03775 [Thermoanaerobaculaceae bacterium]|jgi:hypothetical protein|nr:hypothetical protein [Thermoanaerobaculaceae bacterium]
MRTSSSRRLSEILILGALVATLTAPLADMAFHLDPSPPIYENRTLATFPAATPGTPLARALVSGLPTWADDNFGFRRFLIRQNARLRMGLLGQSAHRSLILGRHGWLYFAGDETASLAQQVRRQRPLGFPYLQRWGDALVARQEWLQKRGAVYLLVVAPDKQSIHPEMLPGWLVPAATATGLDQLVWYGSIRPGLPFLDLRAALRPLSGAYPLFYALDSHWNEVGGLAAGIGTIEAASRLRPGIRPLTWDRVTVGWTDRTGGDLAWMTGVGDLLTERVPTVSYPELPGATETNLEPCEPCGEPANPLLPTMVYEQPGVPWRGVLFSDSFRVALVPALRPSFGRLVVVSPKQMPASHKTLAALVEKEHPHFVIEERVERWLRLPPELPPRR